MDGEKYGERRRGDASAIISTIINYRQADSLWMR
jgi:hypothetical protein